MERVLELKREEINQARKEVLSLLNSPAEDVFVKKVSKENIVIERTQQETCMELIASGVRPVGWLFIKDGEILAGWGDPDSFWTESQFCENFNIEKKEYHSICFDIWDYWGTSSSPYIPAFKDISTHSDERGEVRYGEDSNHDFDGHIDKSFDFSNSYLYVEYECEDDEAYAEIYVLGDTENEAK